MSRTKKKTGFTLIELLVVVSIIALLVSILLPALGRARQQARMVLCSSNVRSMAMANTMFAADNDGRFYFTNKGGNWWTNGSEFGGFRIDASDYVKTFFNGGYMDNPESFYCPMDMHRSKDEESNEDWLNSIGAERRGISYCYLAAYEGIREDENGIALNPSLAKRRPMLMSDRPRPLIADEHGWTPEMSFYWNHYSKINNSFRNMSCEVNVAFSDGHAIRQEMQPETYSYGFTWYME